MMSEKPDTIILACSGASNTGAYSDKVARGLMAEGKAKMLCLARFAVDPGFAEKSKRELLNDARILVLDGCLVNCAKKILKENGIDRFEHIHITDYGIEKGKTPVQKDKIIEIIDSLTGNSKK
jgi:uncharacterized metal-binding protein